MTTRESMIGNIRSSLSKSDQFERLYHHLQPSERRAKSLQREVSPTELADRFTTELTAVGGEVHRVANEETAIETIRQILDELKAERVAISDVVPLKNAPFGKVELITHATREDLFSVDAGISTAQLTIAETGTLVLRSSSERHRLVSLVPPIHICLVRSVDIRRSMDSVLEEMSDNIDPTITFITGPSRTSDIELTLAIGVHGPKRLIVILID